jgi:hypothetical protein
MSGLLACCCAQTEFVWKLVDLYGKRTDWRNSPFMGGVVAAFAYPCLALSMYTTVLMHDDTTIARPYPIHC